LAQDGKQLIVLFGGGTKKGQQSDVNQAKELYQEYKERKKKASETATQEENEKEKRKKKKKKKR
jgi:hypothetical protein